MGMRGPRMGGHMGGGRGRRRECEFTKLGILPDYKDIKRLQKYITAQGKILPRRRTGVTARVTIRKRSPHCPKVSWISSIGLAPRLVPVSPNARHTMEANGTRQRRNSAGLTTRRTVAAEIMDEDRGIREFNPELYEVIVDAPMYTTRFVISPSQEHPLSVSLFLTDPSNGYIVFPRYSDIAGDTDYVLRRILESNQ